MDLNDLNLTNILKKYDVEYNETDKIGSKRDAAEDQAKAIANELKSQLKAKAKKMCEANGVKFNENAFNTQFNNSVAYALEHCNMSNNGKKYNATQFLKNFLTKFESNYTSWVNRQ